jgi:hypothetical protein
MSATYINTGGGLIQYSGIITAAEMNTLGTAPYNFTTPENFAPLGFLLTAISGTTQPIFSSILSFETLSNNRPLFYGVESLSINITNYFGLRTTPLITPTHTQALNIELNIINNFILIPVDGNDPTPGDYNYKYNLIGTILF